MNNNEFILWLEGFLDGADGNGLSSEQLKKIKEKLKQLKGISSISFLGTPNGGNTSITYGYPSGSSWSYTNTAGKDIEGIEKDLLLD